MSHDRAQTATRMPPAAPQPGGGHSAVPGAMMAAEQAVLRRTAEGWRVGAEDLPDLTCAMVLADLLAADLGLDEGAAAPAADQTGPHQTGLHQTGPHQSGQPPAPGRDATSQRAAGPNPDSNTGAESPADEARRLRATVSPRQHAQTARIGVEQASGVLAERHRIRPRQAFEQLRSAARNRGRRVTDIAADVVASASNPLLQLPDELSRPRSGSRHARQRGLTDPEVRQAPQT